MRYPNRIHAGDHDNDSIFSPIAPLLAIGAVSAIGMSVAMINRNSMLRSKYSRIAAGMDRYPTQALPRVDNSSAFSVLRSEAAMNELKAMKKQRLIDVARMAIQKEEEVIANEVSDALGDLMNIRYNLSNIELRRAWGSGHPFELAGTIADTLDEAILGISTGKPDSIRDAITRLKTDIATIQTRPNTSVEIRAGDLQQVLERLQGAEKLYTEDLPKLVNAVQPFAPGAVTAETAATILGGSPATLAKRLNEEQIPGGKKGRVNRERMEQIKILTGFKTEKINNRLVTTHGRVNWVRKLRGISPTTGAIMPAGSTIKVIYPQIGVTGNIEDLDRVVQAAGKEFRTHPLLKEAHKTHLRMAKNAKGNVKLLLSSPDMKTSLKRFTDGVVEHLGVNPRDITFTQEGANVVSLVKFTDAPPMRFVFPYEEAGLSASYGHNVISASKKSFTHMGKGEKKILSSSITNGFIDRMVGKGTGSNGVFQKMATAGDIKNGAFKDATSRVLFQRKVKGIFSGGGKMMTDVTNASPEAISNAVTTFEELPGTDKISVLQIMKHEEETKLSTIISNPTGNRFVGQKTAVLDKINSLQRQINKLQKGYSADKALTDLERTHTGKLKVAEVINYNNNNIIISELSKDGFIPTTSVVTPERALKNKAWGLEDIRERYSDPGLQWIKGSKSINNMYVSSDVSIFSPSSSDWGRRISNLKKRSKHRLKLTIGKKEVNFSGVRMISRAEQVKRAALAGDYSTARGSYGQVNVLFVDSIGGDAGELRITDEVGDMLAGSRDRKVSLNSADIRRPFSGIDQQMTKALKKVSKENGLIDLTAPENWHVRKKLNVFLPKIKDQIKTPYEDIKLTAITHKATGSYEFHYTANMTAATKSKILLGANNERLQVHSTLSKDRMFEMLAAEMDWDLSDANSSKTQFLRDIGATVGAKAPLSLFKKGIATPGAAAGLGMSITNALVFRTLYRVQKILADRGLRTMDDKQATKIVQGLLKIIDNQGELGRNVKFSVDDLLGGATLLTHMGNKSTSDTATLIGRTLNINTIKDPDTYKKMTKGLAKVIEQFGHENKSKSANTASEIMDSIVKFRDGEIRIFGLSQMYHTAPDIDETFKMSSGKFGPAGVGGDPAGTITSMTEVIAAKLSGFNSLADKAQLQMAMGMEYTKDYFAIYAGLLEPSLMEERLAQFGTDRFKSKNPGKQEVLTIDKLMSMAKRDKDGKKNRFFDLFKTRYGVNTEAFQEAVGEGGILFGKQKIEMAEAMSNIQRLVNENMKEVDLEKFSGNVKKQIQEIMSLSPLISSKQAQLYHEITRDYKFLELSKKHPLKILGVNRSMSRVPMVGFFDIPTRDIPDNLMDVFANRDLYAINQKIIEGTNVDIGKQVIGKTGAKIGKDISKSSKVLVQNAPHRALLNLMTAVSVGADEEVIGTFADRYTTAIQQYSQAVGRTTISPRVGGSLQTRPLQSEGKFNLAIMNTKAAKYSLMNAEKVKNMPGALSGTRIWQPDLGEIWMDKSTFINVMKSEMSGDHRSMNKATQMADEIMAESRIFTRFYNRKPTLGQDIRALRVRLFDAEMLTDQRFAGKVASGEIARLKKSMILSVIDQNLASGDFDGDTGAMVMAMFKGKMSDNADVLADWVVGNSFRYQTSDGNIKVFENSGRTGRAYMETFQEVIETSAHKSDNKRLSNQLSKTTVTIEQQIEHVAGMVPDSAERGQFYTKVRDLAKKQYGDDLSQAVTFRTGIGDIRFWNNSTSIPRNLIRAKRAAEAKMTERATGINTADIIEEGIEATEQFLGDHGMVYDHKGIAQELKATHAGTGGGKIAHAALANMKDQIDYYGPSRLMLKAGTGPVYNFMHNHLWNAAINTFGITSQQSKDLVKWGRVPQQANISMKHMLPGIAGDAVNNLKTFWTAIPGSSAHRNSGLKLKTGNYDFTLTKFWGNQVKRTQQIAKKLGDDSLDDMLEKVTSFGTNPIVKDDGVINLGDFIRLQDRRLKYMERGLLAKVSDEGIAATQKSKSVSEKLMNELATEDRVYNEIEESGAFFRSVAGSESATSHIMNKKIFEGGNQRIHRSFRALFSGENIGKHVDDDILRGTLGQVAQKIAPAKIKPLFTRPNVAKYAADSISRKAARLIEGTSLRKHIDTKGMKAAGMGMTLLGTAAVGFLAFAAASPGGQPWLGPKPGYGGEYNERRRRKDEEHMENITTTGRSKLKFLDGNSYPDYTPSKTARIYIDPQKKRYATVSQTLRSVQNLGNAGIMDFNKRQMVSGGTTINNMSRPNGYGGF